MGAGRDHVNRKIGWVSNSRRSTDAPTGRGLLSLARTRALETFGEFRFGQLGRINGLKVRITRLALGHHRIRAIPGETRQELSRGQAGPAMLRLVIAQVDRYLNVALNLGGEQVGRMTTHGEGRLPFLLRQLFRPMP
jgi:hypothetical protein